MTASLRDLQLALLEMLKDIDAICKENKITYSLAGGTALGAVRHGGYNGPPVKTTHEKIIVNMLSANKPSKTDYSI